MIERHIELLKHLEEFGETDLLPTTIDSYTRLNRYKEAQVGLEESIRLDKAMLNGLPGSEPWRGGLPPGDGGRQYAGAGAPWNAGRAAAGGNHAGRRLYQL